MVNRKELRKRIPKGYCKVIAERAGVTVVAISKYFSGEINSDSIELAALEVAAEIKKTKSQLLKVIYEEPAVL